jgi:ribonuclease T1
MGGGFRRALAWLRVAVLALGWAGAAAAYAPGEVGLAQLPREARETLALIKAGGPFAHERDGIVFGNREGLLPRRARGYYREYTVRTPGERTRGARRIVAGEGPGRDVRGSGEYWYTDDHYRSFRRIRE